MDCRWISITILCVSFSNAARVGRLEQVQLCHRRVDQLADNITGLKCANECLILTYKYIQKSLVTSHPFSKWNMSKNRACNKQLPWYADGDSRLARGRSWVRTPSLRARCACFFSPPSLPFSLGRFFAPPPLPQWSVRVKTRACFH